MVGASGSKNRRVSGVWIFNNLNAWNLNKGCALYLHHDALYQLPEKFYSLLSYKLVLDDHIKSIQGRSVYEHLKLDWKWVQNNIS
ncbi:hypothetical protein LDG_5562 [Legionella drancourtii LLAP12]|uniref:Uncharacterized protein n=1 Tax=Legionella drancourtii LLAP12 TaxID=658187 RepID=G9EK39_9GAMM|nr:hypothetical protein LDG_5562 [Legionella drancourtii LLAP12]